MNTLTVRAVPRGITEMGGLLQAAGAQGPSASDVVRPVRPRGVALSALGFGAVGAVEVALSTFYAISGAGAIGSLNASNSTATSGLNSTQAALSQYLAWAYPTQTVFNVGFAIIGLALIAVAYLLYTGKRRGRTLGPWLFVLSGLLYLATTLLFLQAPPGLLSSSDIGYYVDLSAAEVLVGVLLFLYFRTGAVAAYLRR